MDDPFIASAQWSMIVGVPPPGRWTTLQSDAAVRPAPCRTGRYRADGGRAATTSTPRIARAATRVEHLSPSRVRCRYADRSASRILNDRGSRIQSRGAANRTGRSSVPTTALPATVGTGNRPSGSGPSAVNRRSCPAHSSPNQVTATAVGRASGLGGGSCDTFPRRRPAACAPRGERPRGCRR